MMELLLQIYIVGLVASLLGMATLAYEGAKYDIECGIKPYSVFTLAGLILFFSAVWPVSLIIHQVELSNVKRREETGFW